MQIWFLPYSSLSSSLSKNSILAEASPLSSGTLNSKKNNHGIGIQMESKKVKIFEQNITFKLENKLRTSETTWSEGWETERRYKWDKERKGMREVDFGI